MDEEFLHLQEERKLLGAAREELAKVKKLMDDYNYDRPHDVLGGCSPADMLAVDSWKTRNEFPTNPRPATTTIINEIV